MYVSIIQRRHLCGAGKQLERILTHKGTVKSWNGRRKLNFIQTFRLYVVLKLLCEPHGHVSLPTLCLFSIGHCLHPRIFYASGIMSKNFCFSGSHFVEFIYDGMYMSTTSAGFIADPGNIFEQYFYCSKKQAKYVENGFLDCHVTPNEPLTDM